MGIEVLYVPAIHPFHFDRDPDFYLVGHTGLNRLASG